MKMNSLRVLQVALVLGWATDVLFYGKSLGISVPLFVGLILSALFYLGRQEGVRSEPRNLWLIAPLFFFAIMVFVRANATLTLINVLLVLTILGLLIFFYSSGRIQHLGLFGYPVVLAIAGLNALTQQVPAVTAATKSAAAHKGKFRQAGPLLRGLILAVPVLIVFTFLLSSADTIFAGYIGDLLRLDFMTDAPEMLWRTLLVLLAAWVLAGALFFAVRRQTQPAAGPDDLPGNLPSNFSIGFIESVTVLGLVNLLFLAFAWIQFAFLFSGEALRTMHYEVYREYVRRGFGELLAVAVLTMALILGLRWLAWRETAREARIFKLLSTAMVMLAMVMLVSAFMRMVFWESIEFYINTQLRIYVRWFIAWLGVLFAWMLLLLWVQRRRFAFGAFVAVLGFFVTINLANPDADVAAHNLKRHDELATRYLHLLSDDAIPALVAGLDSTSGYVHDSLVTHLKYRLLHLRHDHNRHEWPAFHLSRWQAYESLKALNEAGKLTFKAGQTTPRPPPATSANLSQ